MNRFFHGRHGAARSYLFAKLFLLMLALDTWMLMIGHAGRYGMTGFNVAHFAWLDRVQPLPSAGFYIAVLLLAGLLSLVLAFAGTHPAAMFSLFLLYTYSWSMSMLDSYQHHYFMSLVLLCMVFFPQTNALEIHPPPPRDKRGKSKLRERDQALRGERAGWLYTGSVVLICALYALLDTADSLLTSFVIFAGALAAATALYRPAHSGGPHLHYGWGFPLLGATVAILYTFTAIAKMDAQWYAGDTLLAISRLEQSFGWLADYAQRLGMERAAFWGAFATAVIPQELFLALCYLLATHQDRVAHPLPRVLCSIGFVASVVLHVGAEAMGLEIGWFSYYMLVLATCFLLPLPVVDRLATVLTWPARAIHQAMHEWDAEGDAEPRALPLLLAVGCAGMLAGIGMLIDLPGALAAALIAGAALLALTAWRVVHGDRARPKRWATASLLGAIAMWLAITLSPVRYDFYRYLGGDLKRRNQPEDALQAYLKAERYAPEGKSRAKQIRQLREQLGRR